MNAKEKKNIDMYIITSCHVSQIKDSEYNMHTHAALYLH